jgi:hypothetical protein
MDKKRRGRKETEGSTEAKWARMAVGFGAITLLFLCVYLFAKPYTTGPVYVPSSRGRSPGEFVSFSFTETIKPTVISSVFTICYALRWYRESKRNKDG